MSAEVDDLVPASLEQVLDFLFERESGVVIGHGDPHQTLPGSIPDASPRPVGFKVAVRCRMRVPGT
jgi:hypothetical protein